MAAGLPLVQILNAYRIACRREQEKGTSKAATFVHYIPLIVLSTTIWLLAWALALLAASRLFHLDAS
jgi:hypothetical protein